MTAPIVDFHFIFRLPGELRQDIVERLDRRDLACLNLCSKACYRLATPLIWQDITLKDQHTIHSNSFDDHHDDTPLIRKLIVIVSNHLIAESVQTLTHCCHLPPPALFRELPRTPFSGQTLSSDQRTVKLVTLAAARMSNVKTLRIILGHPNLNDALLRSFFDWGRRSSVRRLWLENCRISAGCTLKPDYYPISELWNELDFSGLESIRFRRLPLRPALPMTQALPEYQFTYARGGVHVDMQDGAGGLYSTTSRSARHELMFKAMAKKHIETRMYNEEADERLFDMTCTIDDQTYTKLLTEVILPDQLDPTLMPSKSERFIATFRGNWLDPDSDELAEVPYDLGQLQRERQPSSIAMLDVLQSCSATLTSLCLDWVFTMPYYNNLTKWSRTFSDLFALRIPNLKAFQFRNAVVPDTVIPPDFYLLGYSKLYTEHKIVDFDPEANSEPSSYLDLCSLEFMEAHSGLQCLAWPMDRVLQAAALPRDIARRVEAVIDKLSWTLTDLRVDAMYSGVGEPQSENSNCPSRTSRDCRRMFIQHFAAKMRSMEIIKVEGGVPRDERRELLRALQQCPLEKIVNIGVCCPIGNTWGAEGRDIHETLHSTELAFLEPEHKDAIHGLGVQKPEPAKRSAPFQATYGWPPGPPMVHIIASLHADTVRELKFCGYKGAPVLFTPTPITYPMLAALKHFHKLESLIMSMWLNTEFEEAHRDADVINYWLDARSPNSTSLVRITDEEPEGWEKELRTKYAPVALAWWITSYIGQFLSEEAKARKGGVHVRVSMCIGDYGGIFDIDLRIGKGSLNSDVCLGYKGPREELEPDRRREKLETRRWF